MKTFRNKIAAGIAAAAVLISFAVCYAAYVGHEDDRDIAAFLKAYPAAKGTSLDSCALCHRDGNVPDPDKPGKTKYINACDYCHVVSWQGKKPYKESLNKFGLAYLAAGRNAAAFKKIATKDSDGDKFTNAAEIAKGAMPGDANSNPNLKAAPSVSFTLEQLKKIANVEQTIFMSSTKSKSGDTYNDYGGVRLIDVLKKAGMSKNADSVDVISVDGYTKTFKIDELEKLYKQGAPVFGLGVKELGDCGWVHYNSSKLAAGQPLPPANIIIAFEENGKLMDPSVFNKADGRIIGDGPYRVITPQTKNDPPDLPEHADPSCASKVPEANRFHTDYDHNAGNATRATVAIRINPLPKGTRDFDWEKNGWDYIAKKSIIVFGNLTK
ncbi:MAG: GEGP motif-containing diheme protein [bacterium]